jgi:hypothetical protein
MLRTPRFRLAALALAASLVAVAVACAAGARRASRAESSGLQLVPAGAGRYFRFGADGVVEQGDQTVIATQPLGLDGAGRPVASAIDLGSARACVVYERGFANVNLEEGTWSWLPPAWSTTPDCAAAAAGRAVTLSGNTAHLWSLASGGEPVSYDFAPWLAGHSMRSLHFVAPLAGRENTLVAVAAKYPRVVVKLVSTAKGGLTDVSGDELSDFSAIHRCACDGRNVFVAGVHEFAGLNSSGQMVLQQRLRLVQVDLASGERVDLLTDNTESASMRECVVQGLVAGGDLVVMLLRLEGRRELVRAYRIVSEAGGTPAKVWEHDFPAGSALAVVDAKRFAVLSEGRVLLFP